jgi:hypothetical protein
LQGESSHRDAQECVLAEPDPQKSMHHTATKWEHDATCHPASCRANPRLCLRRPMPGYVDAALPAFCRTVFDRDAGASRGIEMKRFYYSKVRSTDSPIDI